RKSLSGAIPPSRIEPLSRAFLEGYESVSGRLPDRIRLYTAVGLVRLAAHPFRFREVNWLGQTEAVLARGAAPPGKRPARPNGKTLVPKEEVVPAPSFSLTGLYSAGWLAAAASLALCT